MRKFMYAKKSIGLSKACSTLVSFCITGVHKVVTPDMLVSDTTALLGVTGAQKLQLTDTGSGGGSGRGSGSDGSSGENVDGSHQELVGADEDYVEVMWADEDELKMIKRMEHGAAALARAVRTGSSPHSHDHQGGGKCCSHVPELPPRDISLPPVLMNMSVDDRV